LSIKKDEIRRTKKLVSPMLPKTRPRNDPVRSGLKTPPSEKNRTVAPLKKSTSGRGIFNFGYQGYKVSIIAMTNLPVMAGLRRFRFRGCTKTRPIVSEAIAPRITRIRGVSGLRVSARRIPVITLTFRGTNFFINRYCIRAEVKRQQTRLVNMTTRAGRPNQNSPKIVGGRRAKMVLSIAKTGIGSPHF